MHAATCYTRLVISQERPCPARLDRRGTIRVTLERYNLSLQG